ncbi:hypothetical protein [Ascidiimonas sp. W6]|uniref:hypothetical protein n=1 Tax=Ascidiimonas meishanensis TaxID=3128903 RepID=UPI0030ED188A
MQNSEDTSSTNPETLSRELLNQPNVQEVFREAIEQENPGILENLLTVISQGIANLTNLDALNPNNQLTELPEGIGDLRNIGALDIDIADNQLAQLPEAIEDLVGIDILGPNEPFIMDLQFDSDVQKKLNPEQKQEIKEAYDQLTEKRNLKEVIAGLEANSNEGIEFKEKVLGIVLSEHFTPKNNKRILSSPNNQGQQNVAQNTSVNNPSIDALQTPLNISKRNDTAPTAGANDSDKKEISKKNKRGKSL